MQKVDDLKIFEQYFDDFVKIYQLSGANTWSDFWNNYFSQRISIQEGQLEDFINSQCNTIARAMTTAGEDNPAVKRFLSALPFNYSKQSFTWPPTTEQIRNFTSNITPENTG